MSTASDRRENANGRAIGSRERRVLELDGEVIYESVIGEEAGWLSRAGMPTAVFGPGDKRVIHRPDEYVELEDVVTYTKAVASSSFVGAV